MDLLLWRHAEAGDGEDDRTDHEAGVVDDGADVRGDGWRGLVHGGSSQMKKAAWALR